MLQQLGAECRSEMTDATKRRIKRSLSGGVRDLMPAQLLLGPLGDLEYSLIFLINYIEIYFYPFNSYFLD